jgi:hypothetical protein
MQNALIEATDEYMNEMLDSKNNNKNVPPKEQFL